MEGISLDVGFIIVQDWNTVMHLKPKPPMLTINREVLNSVRQQIISLSLILGINQDVSHHHFSFLPKFW